MKKWYDKSLQFLDRIYYSSWNWIIFSIFTFLFRLPYYLRAEKRMHGDEAFLWLTNQNNIDGYDFSLHPFNHDYLGVTDFLFTLPFYPFFGNSGLSNQLGLTILYILSSWILVSLTKNIFSDEYGKLTYYLTLLPGSFFMIMSATYHGGHFTASVLGLIAIFFIFKIENQAEFKNYIYSFLIGFFLILSYYTSHLNLLMLFVGFPLYFIYIYSQLKVKHTTLIICSIVLMLGSFLGYVPEILGKIYRVVEPTHNKDVSIPSFIYANNNLKVLLEYGIESISGLLAHPFMRYYGFQIDKKTVLIIKVFSYINFLGIIILLFSYLYKIRNLSIQLLDRRFIFLCFYYILLGGNALALVAISKNVDDFGIRYLMPVIIFTPMILSVAWNELGLFNLKIKTAVVTIFFLITSGGYLNGYTKPAIYTFEGSPGAEEVLEYFQNKDIHFSFSNHWIAYNLIKLSNQKHISSPAIDLMGGMNYPGLHGKVVNASPNNNIGFVQMIGVLPEWYNFIKKDDKGKVIEIREGKFRILEEKHFEKWNVYICKMEVNKE